MIEIVTMATVYMCKYCVLLGPGMGFSSYVWSSGGKHGPAFCFYSPADSAQWNGVEIEFVSADKVIARVGKDVVPCKEKDSACDPDNKECIPQS